MTDDTILPFQLANSAVRGRVVRLGPAIDKILKAHDLSDGVSELVGEAACLVAMMGSALKFDGKLIFQAQGDGPVWILVADYSAGGALRAMAKAEAPGDVRGMRPLIGQGNVVMTIDQGPDMERYQGVTPLDGETLGDAAVGYFAQSEQIPTIVKLTVGKVLAAGGEEHWRAGGIIAQFIPGEGGTRERGEEILMGADDAERWERAFAFVDTTQPDELIDPEISSETLLYRLFHEDGVRVFDTLPVHAACSCDSDKIAAVLARYSEDDLRDMVEDGAINVTCEFCRQLYLFNVDGTLRERVQDGQS